MLARSRASWHLDLPLVSLQVLVVGQTYRLARPERRRRSPRLSANTTSRGSQCGIPGHPAPTFITYHSSRASSHPLVSESCGPTCRGVAASLLGQAASWLRLAQVERLPRLHLA